MMSLNISTKKFFLILSGFALILSLISFYSTLDVPLSPEDLSVYLGYFYFTGDYNIPHCFYWNSFGVLPGEFVYKYGFDIDDIGGAYRPLTTVVFALNFILSGFNPITYHITNIILHLLVSISVGYLVYLMSRKHGLAAFAAIFFLMNPLHTEQTIVIIQVSDILCTLFYTTGFIFFWHYMESEKRKFLLYAIISYIFSIMGKEMSVTFPLILSISYPLLFRKLQFKIGYIKEGIKKLGWFWVILFCYLLFRIIIFGSVGGYPGIYASHDNPESPHLKIGWFVIDNVAEGINKLFLIPGNLLPSRYLWLVLLIIPLFLKLPRILKVSILWIFISIAPISNLYLMSWYLYLPSVGFTAAVTITIGLLWNQFFKDPKQVNRRSPLKPYFIIPLIAMNIGLFTLFFIRIQNKIEKYRIATEYSYNITDEFKEIKPEFPKGSKIYLIVNSMDRTDGNIDYNPALQFVMRIAYDDLYMNLLPIPLNLESDYFIELNKAAILDMSTISIDYKTFFFDYTNWNLELRNDILENFNLKNEIQRNPISENTLFSWDFTSENQFNSWKIHPKKLSLLSSKGHIMTVSTHKQIDLRSPFDNFDSVFVNKVSVSLNFKTQNPVKAYLYWKNKGDLDFSEYKKRTLTINPEPGYNVIEFPVAKDISWIIDRDVSELRLLFSEEIKELIIKSIELN